MIGRLQTMPAAQRPDLLAATVLAGLTHVPAALVCEIDPDLADTAAMSEAYDVPLDVSANCVIVAGRRGGAQSYAACVVLATTRADVNGLVRRRLEARKASFAAMDATLEATGMEYGGITPVGLPPHWALLVDAAVVERDLVVIGSGLRRSKLVLPGRMLLDLPGAELVEALGIAPAIS